MLQVSNRLNDHFSNPRNVGALPGANAVGSFGTIGWGDAVKLMLQVDPQTDRIEQARFQAFGCSAAIAASSAVTEMVTGKTLDEAGGISSADIAEFLGGLPPERMYGSVIAYEALRTAIAALRGKAELESTDPDVLCDCFSVGQMMIERTIRFNRLTDPEQVTAYTKAGASCSCCFKKIEALLARVNADLVEDGLLPADQAYRVGSSPQRAIELKPRGEATAAATIFSAGHGVPAHLRAMPKPAAPKPAAPRPVAAMAGADTLTQTELIEQALAELRPHLQRDGGDCELVRIEDNTIYIRLSGNCDGCQLASVTLSGVQAKLIEKIGRPMRVVPVP
ncbi:MULTISPECIES: Fe-S cluster assembly protein NifU [Rhodopseudomonas]|uniref:Nitrogen fixation protein NifU n=1 Tax=Rhodopseudomonas palustris TaxID=1076 RepID=A0A0D7E706_RHOPL|nr:MULTISPECIES: Fe-S cluster assembly protein NifU [Rhodopseudomonas]KIZ35297.1 nitrogen fixation protein NifU [Rhodopseudomonas palustris]MDF3809070.1 Fe-S cluster assembly protein NifU [Rhodopseudomonas sp. BAL398]WOK15861.1 Fe-S cluster assembly protein NifU [Rhodopseudomonas sp. BAL398]